MGAGVGAIVPAPAPPPHTLAGADTCELPRPGDVVLSPRDAWVQRLGHVAPGTRVYLRAGTYATARLQLPNGTADRPIVIRPYNCEAVAVRAVFALGYHTSLADISLGLSSPVPAVPAPTRLRVLRGP